MTPAQITALAKEAGLHSALILSIYGNMESLSNSETIELQRIHRFAALIEANTREACAKVCNDWAAQHAKDTGECSYDDCDMVAVATDLAEQIRGME